MSAQRSCFLQPLLSGGAPFPFGEAKLVFCLPWLLLSCANALWSHVLWRLSKQEICLSYWFMSWLKMNAFAKVDAMAQAGFVSGSKT